MKSASKFKKNFTKHFSNCKGNAEAVFGVMKINTTIYERFTEGISIKLHKTFVKLSQNEFPKQFQHEFTTTRISSGILSEFRLEF